MAKPGNPIRGIIFDMDGVLCLSEPLMARAGCRLFAETYGITVTPQDFAPFAGTGEEQYLGGVAARYGVTLTMPRDKDRAYAIYLESIAGRLKPLPGVKRLIASARRRGRKLAVATSADRVKLDGNLREIGLPADQFDATVHGGELEHKKPAPDIFLLAAQRLGLDPAECLVIEDAPSGVRAAQAGGLRCLGLTTSFDAAALKRAGADWVAPGLTRLPADLGALLNAAVKPPRPQRRAAPRTRPTKRARPAGKTVAAPAPPPTDPDKLKILFVASECTPFAKTGGLGDVVAGLSKQLVRLGHAVRVMLPLYGSIDRARYGIGFRGTSCVHLETGREQWIGLHQALLDDEVPVWFVDCEQYFARHNLYGSSDDAIRFALLSKAALQVCKDQAFIPDLMHLHDWMTALSAVYLKTWDRILSPLSATASVLTIHNIGYQGKFPVQWLPALGVGWEHYTPDRFEDFGDLNLLKAGIAFSDALTTVSPTHANEIREPLGGMGLAPYINNRSADLFGILNGCDYEHWNPATDSLLPARYAAADLAGKARCKAALQQQFGLAVRSDLPLFGVVSRFAAQKGFNLLIDALPRALDTMAIQFVALGSGEEETEAFFRGLPARYPGRVGTHIGYSNELSHLIEAGSDFFVMPSLYEPCGLNQMYSLKYGTLPIVRATGGLDDTVENYDEATGAGTGFKFWEPTADALHATIGWANATWWDRPRHIARLQQAAMQREYSWEQSARCYLDAYRHALAKRRA